jgi:hypothetical protein
MSKFTDLLNKLNIDETYTKPIKAKPILDKEVGPQIRYIEYKTIHYQKATCISVFCMCYSLKSWQIQLF